MSRLPGRDVWGYPVYQYGTVTRCVRHWHLVPKKHLHRIRIVFDRHWRLYTHHRRFGWVWIGWGRGGRSDVVYEPLPFAHRWFVAVLKRTGRGTGEAPPALQLADSGTLIGPLLAEHIAATKYEDGTVRVPGSFKVENVGSAYRVTVYDHDAGLRLACSGPVLADVYELIEIALGTADAPWEVDRYLTEQIAKRTPRKKK